MAAFARIVDSWMALERRLCRRAAAPSGVLLLSCGGLGDTVLFALVLPRLIRLARAGEAVTVLLRRDAAKMAFLFPPEITVLPVDFGRLAKSAAYRAATQRDLFHANYRLVVTTDFLRHPRLDEALVAACAAPETAAMEPRPWPKYAAALARNRALYARRFDSGGIHVDKLVRWTRFADWLTGETQAPPRVRLPEALLPPPEAGDAPTVMIQPFSAVTLKQYPVDLYERVIGRLPAGTRVAILGAPGDLDRNPEYRRLLERPNVVFDGAPFAAILPRLRGAALVISVDTALMHLAAAAGAPTLCLASAAYVDEIVPYPPETRPDNVDFIFHPMPCQGCLGACVHPAERGMYPCVARVAEATVLDAVAARLGA